jgi:hypothetical protein
MNFPFLRRKMDSVGFASLRIVTIMPQIWNEQGYRAFLRPRQFGNQLLSKINIAEE